MVIAGVYTPKKSSYKLSGPIIYELAAPLSLIGAHTMAGYGHVDLRVPRRAGRAAAADIFQVFTPPPSAWESS